MTEVVRKQLRRIAQRLKNEDVTLKQVEGCLRRLSRIKLKTGEDKDSCRQISCLADKALTAWSELKS